MAELANDRIAADPDVVEHDLGRLVSIDSGIDIAGQASGIRRDGKQRDAVRVSLLAIGSRRNDDQFGIAAIQYDALAAVQDPIVAFGCCGGCYIGNVVSTLRLDEGEGGLQLSRHDRLQPPLLLFPAGRAAQHATREHDICEIGLDDQPLAEAEHEHHEVDRSAAEPAVLFAEWYGRPAEFGERLPHVLAVAPFTS